MTRGKILCVLRVNQDLELGWDSPYGPSFIVVYLLS